MKTASLTLVLCLFFGVAIAEIAECKLISKPADRLACYDNGGPSIAPKQKSGTARTPNGEQGQMIDHLAAENARLDKKISNICRGC